MASVTVTHSVSMYSITSKAPERKFPMFRITAIGTEFEDSLLDSFVMLKGDDLYGPYSEEPIARLSDRLGLHFVQYINEDWT